MRGLLIVLIMIGTLQADRLGSVAGVELDLPLPMSIDKFIDSSIGHIPKAIIKDGLPFFGSKRGDFKGKNRSHKGYDIYMNHIPVIASASGKILEIAHGKLSGTYIKVQHKQAVQTLYIHLTSVTVKIGEMVKKGEVLGRIDAPAGNAVAAQLHFEIKLKGKHQNPLDFIKESYHDTVLEEKIMAYETLMKETVIKRNELVKEYLSVR